MCFLEKKISKICAKRGKIKFLKSLKILSKFKYCKIFNKIKIHFMLYLLGKQKAILKRPFNLINILYDLIIKYYQYIA